MAEKEKIAINWLTVLKLAGILLIISAVASLALALVNYVTAPTIEQQNIQANDEARQIVLQDADSFKQIEDLEQIANTEAKADKDIIVEAYAGYSGNEVVGYTVKTVPKGYGGEIEVLTGFTVDEEISGISILSHEETAGLGALATEPSFQDQFKGKDATKEISVSKTGDTSENNISAITGATITSDAVTRGVNVSEKIATYLVQEGGTQ